MKIAIILTLIFLLPVGDAFNRWARTGGISGRTYTKWERSGTSKERQRQLSKRLHREERKLGKVKRPKK